MLPILCYHKVGAEADEGRWLNVHPDRLRAHVRYFKRRGYRAVKACDLSEDTWPDRAVCFTFDDAYTSMLENGMPVLLSEGVTASIYVVPSKVGGTSDWDADRAARLADWQQILEAQSVGMEIGNHTMSHARLSEVESARVQAEFAEAQEALVGQGIEARSIAYPYGAWNEANLTAAYACGLVVGLSLEKRPARVDDHRLRLPRIVVSYGDSLASLMYKIWIRPILP